MPYYFAIDPDAPRINYKYETSYPCAKSRRAKLPRARSGSISITSHDNFPVSPVNRFAQSMGPERTKPTAEKAWRRHTTPAMSTRGMEFYCDYNWPGIQDG
ncbi:hypothetical protein PF008_g23510 [Phytophthora fragariae]|uniref:Uncharacterized protein n=1 Tax=Phytophthora fragariae TaxID=53985 RepID=A0A6G0QQI4_9STRA|nr:hypothetical protein PF008_g23510 [Phytophthora fragariae]